MKPQDLIFFLVLTMLIYFRNSRYAAIAGLISLFLSIPLFALWIFFTAERLTWYAAVFLLLSIGLTFYQQNKSKK